MRRFGGVFQGDSADGEARDSAPTWRFSTGTWCLGAAVLGAAVLIYVTLVDIENEKKLAALRAAVEACAASIRTLEGRYEATSITIGQSAIDKQHLTVEFAVSFTTSQSILDERKLEVSPKDPALARRSRRIDAANGTLTFLSTDLRAAPTDWGQPHWFVGHQNSQNRASTLWHLAALATPASGVTNPGLVRLWSLATENWGGDAKYEGTEKVNGARCERVTIRYPDRRVTFWLDPEHDYLPRRQEFIDLAPAGKPGKTTTNLIETFEFAGYRDVESGDTRWFPARGREQWHGVQVIEYHVKDLTINPTLESGRFQIDIDSLPDGVQTAGAVGHPAFTGDRRDLFEAREEAYRVSQLEAMQKGLFPQLPHVAAPVTRDLYRDALARVPWWGYAVVVAGAGLLVGLVISRFRRQRLSDRESMVRPFSGSVR